MMRLLRFLRGRAPYEPEKDDLVTGLKDAAERERQRADTIRQQRREGNYMTDRLILPRPDTQPKKEAEGK